MPKQITTGSVVVTADSASESARLLHLHRSVRVYREIRNQFTTISEADVWFASAASPGKGESCDRAVADFSDLYADQNEYDYRALIKALKAGEIKAESGV